MQTCSFATLPCHGGWLKGNKKLQRTCIRACIHVLFYLVAAISSLSSLGFIRDKKRKKKKSHLYKKDYVLWNPTDISMWHMCKATTKKPKYLHTYILWVLDLSCELQGYGSVFFFLLSLRSSLANWQGLDSKVREGTGIDMAAVDLCTTLINPRVTLKMTPPPSVSD